MFDVGFWEILLIMLLALIVAGPERLPRLATTVGRWVGNARRLVGNLQADLERHVQVQDMNAKQTLSDLKQGLQDAKQEVSAVTTDTKAVMTKLASPPKPVLKPTLKPTPANPDDKTT